MYVVALNYGVTQCMDAAWKENTRARGFVEGSDRRARKSSADRITRGR